MSSNNLSVYKLLQPNLLSKEELLANLEHRCIKLDNMGGMSKEQLVDLYSRVVTPLEQRITRRTPQTSTSSPENTPMDCTESCDNINKRTKMIYYNTNENIVNNYNHNGLKRKTNDTKIVNDFSAAKKFRQKICWP